jgi:ubiquinone/menaquinone biosynthesis C-methylase UbiE
VPILPNFLERLIFLRLNQAPGPLLDLFGAVAFRTALAALRLGLFDVLSRGPMSAEEVAHQIKADERGTTVLLEALEPLGYVSKKGNLYSNAAMTAKWLVRDSPGSVAPGHDFWGTALSELWQNLEESIRRGQSPTKFYEWLEGHPSTLQDFQKWTIATAHSVLGEVVAKAKLPPTARRLLDVGGGHGLYSIAFCRRYPQLSATVFDLPGALKVGREVIEAEKMGDRVKVQEGDFWADDLGAGYDVALLFNIIHAYLPDKNVELLGKVVSSLNPGGVIIILEQLAGKAPSPTARAITRLFGLAYFHLLGGQIYAFDEIARWLTTVGFTNPRRVNLLRSPGVSLVMGTKAR